MTEIPLKPKKWLRYPWNLKNDQNNPETYKITKIPLKFKKWPKYPRNLKNDWITLET